MKKIALMLSLCLTMNVFAASGTIQELERAVDDFNYALSVDWDQRDQSFYQEQVSLFYQKLETLIKDRNLTSDDVLRMAESKVADPSKLNALKLKLSLLSSVSSPNQLADVVMASSTNLYAQGASWNGEILVPLISGVVVAALIGYAIWWKANHKCVASSQQWVCYTHNNCHYGYNGYCGPSYTTCGWSDVCTDYERK